MKIATFLIIFILCFVFQACMTKLIDNYWFPNETASWILRLCVTFFLSIYAFLKIEKDI